MKTNSQVYEKSGDKIGSRIVYSHIVCKFESCAGSQQETSFHSQTNMRSTSIMAKTHSTCAALFKKQSAVSKKNF